MVDHVLILQDNEICFCFLVVFLKGGGGGGGFAPKFYEVFLGTSQKLILTTF